MQEKLVLAVAVIVLIFFIGALAQMAEAAPFAFWFVAAIVGFIFYKNVTAKKD